jgi:hypothetical protein
LKPSVCSGSRSWSLEADAMVAESISDLQRYVCVERGVLV